MYVLTNTFNAEQAEFCDIVGDNMVSSDSGSFLHNNELIWCFHFVFSDLDYVFLHPQNYITDT